MVRKIASEAVPQGVFPSAVMVSVTDPVEISEPEGVYTGFNKASLLKVPDPEVVHKREGLFVVAAAERV